MDIYLSVFLPAPLLTHTPDHFLKRTGLAGDTTLFSTLISLPYCWFNLCSYHCFCYAIFSLSTDTTCEAISTAAAAPHSLCRRLSSFSTDCQFLLVSHASVSSRRWRSSWARCEAGSSLTALASSPSPRPSSSLWPASLTSREPSNSSRHTR